MAQSKLRAAASALSKGSKALTEVARQIRALDALQGTMTEEQRAAAFSKVVGDLRAFRATTLAEVIGVLSPEEEVIILEEEV